MSRLGPHCWFTADLHAALIGRVYLVAAGLAPSMGMDLIKVVVEGAIALALVVYIAR